MMLKVQALLSSTLYTVHFSVSLSSFSTHIPKVGEEVRISILQANKRVMLLNILILCHPRDLQSCHALNVYKYLINQLFLVADSLEVYSTIWDFKE